MDIAGIMPDQIGGGEVRQPIMLNGTRRTRGDALSAEEIGGMLPSNLRAMVERGFIQVWPKSRAERDRAPVKRHLVSRGFGKYDVIEGAILNGEPLTKEEAQALVGPELVEEAETVQ